jgi:hypothetical protein
VALWRAQAYTEQLPVQCTSPSNPLPPAAARSPLPQHRFQAVTLVAPPTPAAEKHVPLPAHPPPPQTNTVYQLQKLFDGDRYPNMPAKPKPCHPITSLMVALQVLRGSVYQLQERYLVITLPDFEQACPGLGQNTRTATYKHTTAHARETTAAAAAGNRYGPGPGRMRSL